MSFLTIFLIGYLLGGLTLFPLLLSLYVYLPTFTSRLQQVYRHYIKPVSNNDNKNDIISTLSPPPLYKVGWLRMTQGKPPIISLSKPSQRPFFAVLKHHTLYLYDSEQQLDCQQVLSLQQYKVSMYPSDIQDPEMFSRPYWIQLTRIEEEEEGGNKSLYLHCHLCTEKEDWYQVLLQASGLPRVPVSMGSLQPLIHRIHGDGYQLELQWFNALMGRLFLGIHQTERFRQAVWTKVMTKVGKINARRPPFLGEIQVRAVDIGGNLPLMTRPRLIGLTPQGECKLEAMIDYQGADLHIEIATVLQWTYSDRLPPLTMDIVLRVTLQSLQGKINVLIKPPPCNRLWYGFEGLPDMKWHIAPLVWETKVGHSMVVKAIIKHLEEVFRDTMVMPHMDDITFFDSMGLGGIYQELDHTFSNTELNQSSSTTTASSSSTLSISPPIMDMKHRIIKKDKSSVQSEPIKKDERTKQDDMQLLSTVRSLPELISAHTQLETTLSSSPSSTISSPNDSHTLSPPDQNDITDITSPALRHRRSLAHLGQQQKTSASTALAQVNTAAGLFLGKSPVHSTLS
ncbi:putative integral membrane protein conserved region-domain-containing protein [Halteromyces radiatus]|uniref:putative integral membrane protein conserved region-domain-containing protein n=1 Tax=Halteromyces radiatus TaxID=101107 RepID=UPI00221F90D2|nr:putative integral membrane protein conserved region-domain-containing protein [Halteromyces radiatus]KAI8099155.1 putative integral membrane protein conserved region-domain-containing protein [Halteromyces radiatus]